MGTLFVGTVIVSVALGAKFGPVYGFLFFGAICIISGIAEAFANSGKKD